MYVNYDFAAQQFSACYSPWYVFEITRYATQR